MARMAKTEFKASGIITLTTDFGLRDPYVGAMKGVILRQNPKAQIVDLCHFISPQSIHEAAFFLRGSWEYFPPGSIHVIVVDPGVGTKRSILVGRRGGHLFLAPDNGVLTEVLQDNSEVWKIEEAKFALPSLGRTFHGRDIFAPVAGQLSAGLALSDVGNATTEWTRSPLPTSKPVNGGVGGEILLVDRFGNLVTSLTEADLDPVIGGNPKQLEIQIGNVKIQGLAGTYRDGQPGQPLALIGSYGHLEIAVPMGNAAEKLGIRPGAAVQVVRGK